MRADARRKRDAILNAAWNLFALHGPEVSLRVIAAEADVGIATLYRHFPTRDDLVVGLVESMGEKARRVIGKYVDAWDGERDTWRSFVHELAQLGLAAVAIQTIALIDLDGPVWNDTEASREQLMESYSTILDLAVSSGFVNRDLSPWRFHLALGALSRPLPEQARQLMPDHVDWLIDNFITGLEGTAGTPG